MDTPVNMPLRREDARPATEARPWVAPIPTSVRRDRNDVSGLAILWVILLFVAYFALTTRHITFPFFYHWDEEGKAYQVVSGYRNFNHPLLLVNGVSAIRAIWFPDMNGLQDVTVLGRVVSAAFAAGALSMLALSAWIVAGPLAGLMAGILIGLDAQLFQVAHYFKEDPAMLFGWAALITSIACYNRRPGIATVLLAGSAGALTVSAKYIGILPAMLALPFLGMSGKAGRGKTIAFVVTFAAVCLLVNLQLIQAPYATAATITREIDDLRNDWRGSRPWHLWGRAMGVGGIVAMGLAMIRLRRGEGPDLRTQWFVLATMVLYFVATCLVSRAIPRYMLPVCLLSWWFAAIGVAWLLRVAVRHRLALLLAYTLVAVLVVIRADEGRSGWRLFSGPDTRAELARRLDRLARAGDRIMLDFTVNLPGAYVGHWGHQRQVDGWMPTTPMLPVGRWNPARGHDMYESLLREGFTLVAVNPVYLDRYLVPLASGQFRPYVDGQWRRAFYRRLMSEGRVETAIDGVRGSLVSTGLILIRIAAPR